MGEGPERGTGAKAPSPPPLSPASGPGGEDLNAATLSTATPRTVQKPAQDFPAGVSGASLLLYMAQKV